MSTQTGPRLATAGSCEGCEWLRVEESRRTARSRSRVILCGHPKAREDGMISATGTHKQTPAWCPELPAARLALARAVVAEGPFPRTGDAWFDAWAQSRGAARGAGESEE